jgi:hypothetical protein
MKKLILISILLLLAFPGFSQEKDSRAPFQGIWHDVDDSDTIYAFIDDILFSNTNGGDAARFSVKDNNLILTNLRKLGDNGWKEIDYPATSAIQYMFSGDRLILVYDGNVTILSRIDG